MYEIAENTGTPETGPDSSSTPEEALSHGTEHTFEINRVTARPGTAGPPDVSTGRGLTARGAIDWIRNEVQKL